MSNERKELIGQDLEAVSGGTTIVSDQGKVGFTALTERYYLSSTCPSWQEARDFSEKLLDENPGLSDAEFDALAKKEFIKLGWLGEAY